MTPGLFGSRVEMNGRHRVAIVTNGEVMQGADQGIAFLRVVDVGHEVADAVDEDRMDATALIGGDDIDLLYALPDLFGSEAGEAVGE